MEQALGASADADRGSREPSPEGLGPDGLRSTSGHTPGPWLVQDGIHIRADDPDSPGEPWHVAVAMEFCGYYGDDSAANARLIAAAPELADALTACRNQFDFYAREHRAAGKHEKAGTNERFAFLATQALIKAGAA